MPTMSARPPRHDRKLYRPAANQHPKRVPQSSLRAPRETPKALKYKAAHYRDFCRLYVSADSTPRWVARLTREAQEDVGSNVKLPAAAFALSDDEAGSLEYGPFYPVNIPEPPRDLWNALKTAIASLAQTTITNPHEYIIPYRCFRNRLTPFLTLESLTFGCVSVRRGHDQNAQNKTYIHAQVPVLRIGDSVMAHVSGRFDTIFVYLKPLDTHPPWLTRLYKGFENKGVQSFGNIRFRIPSPTKNIRLQPGAEYRVFVWRPSTSEEGKLASKLADPRNVNGEIYYDECRFEESNDRFR